MLVLVISGTEDFVSGMKEDTPHLCLVLGVSLAEGYEVIHKNIKVGSRSGAMGEARVTCGRSSNSSWN